MTIILSQQYAEKYGENFLTEAIAFVCHEGGASIAYDEIIQEKIVINIGGKKYPAYIRRVPMRFRWVLFKLATTKIDSTNTLNETLIKGKKSNLFKGKRSQKVSHIVAHIQNERTFKSSQMIRASWLGKDIYGETQDNEKISFKVTADMIGRSIESAVKKIINHSLK